MSLQVIGEGARKWDEFSKVISPGDIIIPKKGTKTYLGYGIVESKYIYDDSRDDYKNTLIVNWKKTGNFTEPAHPIVLTESLLFMLIYLILIKT